MLWLVRPGPFILESIVVVSGTLYPIGCLFSAFLWYAFHLTPTPPMIALKYEPLAPAILSAVTIYLWQAGVIPYWVVDYFPVGIALVFGGHALYLLHQTFRHQALLVAETVPQKGSMRSLVYAIYLVVGVVVLCGLLFLYLTETENAAWLFLGGSNAFYFVLAPVAAVLTIIALFRGVDWKLVILLGATLILLGVVYFFLFVLGYLSYPVWFVLFHVSYAIVALALPIWHFMSEKTTSDSSVS